MRLGTIGAGTGSGGQIVSAAHPVNRSPIQKSRQEAHAPLNDRGKALRRTTRNRSTRPEAEPADGVGKSSSPYSETFGLSSVKVYGTPLDDLGVNIVWDGYSKIAL